MSNTPATLELLDTLGLAITQLERHQALFYAIAQMARAERPNLDTIEHLARLGHCNAEQWRETFVSDREATDVLVPPSNKEH
ncbi:hypothetical protein [Alloalcanivorax xenomutans]|uniref:hypothetical protein n=1 Tax=Alloalcanivorax xenomutans TaxID=1094342 RepID=UPI001F38A02C|nr:hypothetical protein [Alloalcanivorax xenomutans]MCE7521972.1 hypothetical protein [Alloalcanivorax xenomutans]